MNGGVGTELMVELGLKFKWAHLIACSINLSAEIDLDGPCKMT